MEKVKCIRCGSTGYTASPEAIRCGICGGREEIIEMELRERGLRRPVTAYLRRLLSLQKPPKSRHNKVSIVFTGV